MEVFAVLKDIIVEIKDCDPDNVTMESSFQEDLEADSLDIVEMLMLLEEKFDIQIPEEAAEQLKTVGDAARYVQSRLEEKA